MKYKNAPFLALEALARDGAVTLARLAGWELKRDATLLQVIEADLHYVSSADLILIPSADGCVRGLSPLLHETRCAALLISPGRTNGGKATFYMTIVRHEGERIRHHSGLRLWAEAPAELWLAPDPHGEDPGGPFFRIADGRLATWHPQTVAAHSLGFRNADALMASAMKRR
ncbi:hypothetical protein E2493_16655 [Sphingomonas parva]|uniref:Uncharacterized protein n=1 Tax=Sphingomonas parva TaxID=2555898 RepID=A0A4Y8ZQP0_9SPHN|nr:hypothetical protein [Sphingomonas parva]TFI57139.1 hypothetical protein E2493_16655 [Sphingomonas parva]